MLSNKYETWTDINILRKIARQDKFRANEIKKLKTIKIKKFNLLTCE